MIVAPTTGTHPRSIAQREKSGRDLARLQLRKGVKPPYVRIILGARFAGSARAWEAAGTASPWEAERLWEAFRAGMERAIAEHECKGVGA